MEQVIRVSVFLGFFSSFFCREGIRVSDKRVVSAAQIGNAGQVSVFFLSDCLMPYNIEVEAMEMGIRCLAMLSCSLVLYLSA